MATVRKRRGVWVADFRDQHGRRRIETPQGMFQTSELQRRAARELLVKRLSEVGGNCFTSCRERMTFKHLAETWLKSKVRIGDTTLSDYQIMLECFLVPYFGMRKVETLTRLNIEAFRSDMKAELPECCRLAREAKLKELQTENPGARLKPLKNPGVRTINKCLGVLVSILRYGQNIRVVSENVAAGIEKLPVAQGEDRCIEKNVLTPVELRAVLRNTIDPFRIPIALAIYTGMREEEIIGLKWRDFSQDFSTFEIRRVYRRKRFAKPKTASSLRTVEISDELRQILQEWTRRCPSNEHHLVCPSVTGLPMQASALLQRGLLPALERAGVRRVRFHDLRHSFASILLGAGVDVVRVSKALGHANVHITLITYAHAIPKPRQGTADRMADLLHADPPNLAEGTPAIGMPLSKVA